MQKSGTRILLSIVGLLVFWSALATAGERTLHIYTWSDYFDADVLYGFESEFDCRVQVDYFDSNEAMYAKLKAGGGGYDVITPSSYMSSLMDQQGMVEELDHSLLTNLDNIDKTFLAFTEDPEMRYSVPYTRTVTGVGYDSKRVDEADLGSWAIFANSKYANRMTMLNDIREALGAALKYLGHSINTTNQAEVEAAGDVLTEWKANLAKFDVDEAKIGLGAGEFRVVQGYNGDVALVMEENPDISFYVPVEGSSLSSDDFIVVKGSSNVELAHAFINYMMDPEVALANMEGIHYYMPNPQALEGLPEEMKENPAFFVSDEVIAKCEVIRDLGEHNAMYARVWDRVKAAE